MNGDLVTTADLGGLLDCAHAPAGHAATIGVRRYVHAVPFGCVERDGDRVVGLEEKPTIEREVNSGIYAARARGRRPRRARASRSRCPSSSTRLLAAGGPVGAFEIEDDWIDVGQRDQLVAAPGRRPEVSLRGVSVLVTGADGFIGSHLVERLVARWRARPGVLPLQLARLGRLARRHPARRRARARRPARRHPRRPLRGGRRPRASRSSSTSRR